MCCLSSGDMYFFGMFTFFGLALSVFNSVSLFYNSLADFFERLVILSAIVLLIKSPIASAVI